MAVFNSYQQAADLYNKHIGRSRTTECGAPAVRLANHGERFAMLRNCTLRKSGDDYIVRLYNTDIVSMHPDNWMTVNAYSYDSPTTRARIATAVGVYIRTHKNKNLNQPVRFEHWPVVPDMKIDMATHYPHPDTVARMPSDRRAEYKVPNKKARAEFKVVWAELKREAMFCIAIGEWAQRHLDEVSANSWGVCINNFADKWTRPSDLFGEHTTDQLHDVIKPSGYLSKTASVSDINNAFIACLPAARSALLKEYARHTNQWETKGGQLMGEGYWVNEKDR